MKDLEPPGVLNDNISYDFGFARVEMPFETFAGISFRTRYYINVSINRNYGKITKEEDFLVHNPVVTYPEMNPPIHMEFGLPDQLSLEVNLEKTKFHLKDIIKGSFITRLLNIKIKHVEVCLNKKEIYGPPSNPIIESKVIARIEVMDGNPQLNESVPIRLYLSSIEGLTPTQKSIANKFSCQYLLNIMVHDDEGKRYFKSHQVEIFRKIKVQN